MKWHIVGSSGYIAGKLLKRIPQTTERICYSPDKLAGEFYLDLTQRDERIFSQIEEGDFIVFLAAVSSPDICEKDYELAYSINVYGTKWFISECLIRKANVLFFSTDVVNGATELENDENALVRPFGRYGMMKHEIEKNFCKEPSFKVFRLSYVFSGQDKFMAYLDECVRSSQKADVFNGLYRNIIYVEDIIDAVINLSGNFAKWDNWLFNLSGSHLLSRKDLAELYCELVSPSLIYSVSIPSDEFFKARPNVIATQSLYLKELLGRCPITIKDAMKQEFQNKKEE